MSLIRKGASPTPPMSKEVPAFPPSAEAYSMQAMKSVAGFAALAGVRADFGRGLSELP